MEYETNRRGKEVCEVCGKVQEQCFEVYLGGKRRVFDSFECAIIGLIPRCRICGGIVLEPAVRIEDRLYCGEGCAGFSGVQGYEAPLFIGEQTKR